MKKFLKSICMFVRNLIPKRNRTASEVLLSESLRCSECGCEIRDGEGLFFDRWFCLNCLGGDDEEGREATDRKTGF